MSLLKAKLDVYPLENYVQNPLASAGGGLHDGAVGNQKGHDGGAPRRHKTPLEKLMSLKARCQEEQCVQSVEAVMIAHLHRHPHVILMKQPQVTGPGAAGGGAASARNAVSIAGQRGNAPQIGSATASSSAGFHYRLPGGRCRRGETEEACLQRKLGRQLLNESKMPTDGSGGSASAAAGTANATIVEVSGANAHTSQAASYFRIGEVLGKWYRPNFSPLMYPYVPPHVSSNSVKEVRTVFLVHLEPMVYFNLYREDTELVAVPLFDLYENTAKYGPIIASLPAVLSRVLINYCSSEY